MAITVESGMHAMKIIGFMLLGCACAAGQAQTTITDMLRTGTGAAFQGKLKIDSPRMTLPDGTTIAKSLEVVDVPAGSFSVRLYPNDTASPAGTSYRVTYYPQVGPTWTEVWVVPTSATPLQVSTVSAVVPPSPSLLIALSQLAAGGGTPGQCLVFSGSSWAPGDCAGIRFVDQEAPAGTVDGSNRTFNLTATPTPAASLILTRNGLVQKQSLDYTLSGATITFMPAAVPQPGDVLLAWYRY